MQTTQFPRSGGVTARELHARGQRDDRDQVVLFFDHRDAQLPPDIRGHLGLPPACGTCVAAGEVARGCISTGIAGVSCTRCAAEQIFCFPAGDSNAVPHLRLSDPLTNALPRGDAFEVMPPDPLGRPPDMNTKYSTLGHNVLVVFGLVVSYDLKKFLDYISVTGVVPEETKCKRTPQAVYLCITTSHTPAHSGQPARTLLRYCALPSTTKAIPREIRALLLHRSQDGPYRPVSAFDSDLYITELPKGGNESDRTYTARLEKEIGVYPPDLFERFRAGVAIYYYITIIHMYIFQSENPPILSSAEELSYELWYIFAVLYYTPTIY